MKRLSIALLLLVLVASACSDEADAPATSETGATTTFTLVDGGDAAEDPVQLVPGSITAGVLLVDEIVREYLVAVPPDYSADTPAPLLFNWGHVAAPFLPCPDHCSRVACAGTFVGR